MLFKSSMLNILNNGFFVIKYLFLQMLCYVMLCNITPKINTSTNFWRPLFKVFNICILPLYYVSLNNTICWGCNCGKY